jgi:hypothetical protein
MGIAAASTIGAQQIPKKALFSVVSLVMRLTTGAVPAFKQLPLYL